MPDRRKASIAAAESDRLAIYNAKRDFSRTPEPAGALAHGHANSFIVQKHDATRLHWDFRLEVDGVLKSWAVTRGPSLDPNEKRLAVRTEDHPLSYSDFEGVIPKGEYGGGTVMLWDRGTWSPVAGKSAADLAKGHLHFVLDGERMRGEWMLIRLKPRGREKRENWLLRKVEDDFAGATDALVEEGLTSVASGRTMAEISDGKAAKAKAPPKRIKRNVKRAVAMPGFREPQLCTLRDTVPTGDAWLHEIKFDGYRVMIATGGGKATIFTRTGLDWTDKFPAIAKAAARLPAAALIDGEVVAFKDGRPDFSALKTAISEGGEMVFMAFDLIEQDGDDIGELSTLDRKERLRALLNDAPNAIRFAEHVIGKGEALLEQMCRDGLEGVVSKRADAPYRSGRARAWIKVKCVQRGRFRIVGWLPSDKRRGFRSLLLGQEGPGGLAYAGKVGTGFDTTGMDAIVGKLKRLERTTATVDAPRAMVRGAHWVTPSLAADIAYAEVTPDGLLRHASFLGLGSEPGREDAPEPADGETSVKVTHPDRIIFPDGDITKGQLAEYYARMAGLMLPFIGDRPISLVRCPQGRARKCFFQKHDAGSFGEHVHRVPIRDKDGKSDDYLYVKDADGLVACVQMGAIEFHGWGSRVATLEKSDRMVFDLDPDEGLAFTDTKKAAEHLKEQLAEVGLTSFPMLSGGKGVHVVVPLQPLAEWAEVKSFAERFARALAALEPDRFVATMSKASRKGRIFIDWLRNQRGSTAVMPYSARARNGAPVAVPVSWTELRDIETAAAWTIHDAAALIERASGRALSGWGLASQTLPEL
ncbi:DNA ligase D [Sphingomonas sanguinis]|uniref:DNA ligase D n=1 Tax=Sphingomonas sp. LC-1 TaxID=3110957 RepID=UPI0021BB7CFA|nr:DNA ligase D [Sphingomonas sp. LC-1]MCT8002080.1 DNA ligase D [Sphingomonas sp. LC-1]